jgi:hypothetical protein
MMCDAREILRLKFSSVSAGLAWRARRCRDFEADACGCPTSSLPFGLRKGNCDPRSICLGTCELDAGRLEDRL